MVPLLVPEVFPPVDFSMQAHVFFGDTWHHPYISTCFCGKHFYFPCIIYIPPQPPPPHSASCNVCLFVCAHISKCASAPRKTPPAQVAAGDDDHDCKWSIFASWWKEKHHQRKLHSVNTILGTSIGAGCSNQMQLAQGHHLNADLALVLPAFGCCIPLLYLCPRWC